MTNEIIFTKATKRQAKLRAALCGPPGSGKTYTALTLATNLGERVALLDSERASADKYADEFIFDKIDLESGHPELYIKAIEAAEDAGYDVLVIDSLSHAWMGRDGALELVDKAQKKSQSTNSFFAWREVTPLHNQLVDAMLKSRMHIIATLRTKTEYVVEVNEKGKQAPRKVGLAPIQRDGLEYEFDIVADMNIDNEMIVTKSRCKELTGGFFKKPGKDVANIIRSWLGNGINTHDELFVLLKPNLDSALEFLTGVGWLKEGQSLNKLTEERAKQILARPEDFLKKLKD